jgi:hypothetical protein
VVDVDGELVIDTAQTALKAHVVEHLDQIAAFCGVDIFLLGPKFASLVDGQNANGDAGRDQRWRVAIYGDMESAEHAKTRVLIFIDRLVCRSWDRENEMMGANVILAWPCCRRNHPRIIPPHSRMWTISKKYQAHRVYNQYSYLFPASILAGLQILSCWSPTT